MPAATGARIINAVNGETDNLVSVSEAANLIEVNDLGFVEDRFIVSLLAVLIPFFLSEHFIWRLLLPASASRRRMF